MTTTRTPMGNCKVALHVLRLCLQWKGLQIEATLSLDRDGMSDSVFKLVVNYSIWNWEFPTEYVIILSEGIQGKQKTAI